MDDFKEFLLIVLLAVLIAAVSITGLISFADYQVCETLKQENLNLEISYHWYFWTGCMVRIPDGTLIPIIKMYYGNEKLMIEGLEE